MNPPIVVTRIIGGLGNQLFQYAVGRHLAALNNCELRLDISGFASYELHAYGLNHFDIAAEPATRKDIRRFARLKQNRFIRLLSTGSSPGIRRLGSLHYIEEESLRFDKRVLQVRGGAYLKGYFQSEKYFADIRSLLAEDLRIREMPSPDNREMQRRIEDGISVCIHVRRGDYAANSKTRRIHGLLSSSYYEQAIERVLDADPGAHFFLFSDDIPQAMKVVNLSPSLLTPVSFNSPESNFEDLRLMWSATHHIIANSSFSWWGAWLRRNQNGMVIAPRAWFADQTRDSSDVYPNSWIQL